MTYEHPIYTHRSLAAQARLPALQGDAQHVLLRRLPRLGVPRGRVRLGPARRAGAGVRLVRSALYEGQVVHDRRTGLRNLFRYRVYMWLRRPGRAGRARPAAVGVRAQPPRADHDPLPRPPRRPAAADQGRTWALPRRPRHRARRRPRVAADQRARARLRVQPALGLLLPPAGRRACAASSPRCTTPTASATATCSSRASAAGPSAGKEFYVSPFLTVDGRYRMTLARARRAAVGADGAAPGRRARVRGVADRPAPAAHERHRRADARCATR